MAFAFVVDGAHVIFARNAGNEVFTHTEKASRRVPALTTTLAQAFQFLFAKEFITTA